MEISYNPRDLLQSVEAFGTCDVLYKEKNCSITNYYCCLNSQGIPLPITVTHLQPYNSLKVCVKLENSIHNTAHKHIKDKGMTHTLKMKYKNFGKKTSL